MIYLVEGQEIRAVQFIILEVEGTTGFKPNSESGYVGWLDIRLFHSLGASELTLRVLRGWKTRRSPAAVVMIMGLCKRVMVLGLVLEMLLAMTAVEEGRHVELECYDLLEGYNGAEIRLRLWMLVASGPGAGQGEKDDKGRKKRAHIRLS
jgi:hypothetical protein